MILNTDWPSVRCQALWYYVASSLHLVLKESTLVYVINCLSHLFKHI